MNIYKRHRFPPEIISYAVWLYYRFNLSHRDIEDLVAECEFSALSRQCLKRRLADMETVRKEVDAWTTTRNRSATTIECRFTTEDARIKLKQLYPVISS